VQQFHMKSKLSADSLSQFSLDSATSLDSKDVPLYVAAGDIRRRLSENIAVPKKKFDVCRLCSAVVYLFSFNQ